MTDNQNKYIAVAYKLYTVDNGVEKLVEEATEKEPFLFISGFGIALDAFEKKLQDLIKVISSTSRCKKTKLMGTMKTNMYLTLTATYSA